MSGYAILYKIWELLIYIITFSSAFDTFLQFFFPSSSRNFSAMQGRINISYILYRIRRNRACYGTEHIRIAIFFYPDHFSKVLFKGLENFSAVGLCEDLWD